MVGGFAADAGGDDLPPFDVRVRHPRPSPLQLPPKRRTPPLPLGSPTQARAAPSAIRGAAPSIPQTEDEAKALIRSVFGQATIFKPVE